MSTDFQHADRDLDDLDIPPVPDIVEPVEDDAVEIHRDGPMSATIGTLAGALALAYLLRAVGSGGVLDWVLFVITGCLATLHLAAFADSRAPLMVLDARGVRVRRGASWQGVSWPEVIRVEHRARRSVLRDGALAVVDTAGRRLSVRLSLSTRLIGADWHELSGAIADLTEGRVEVIEPAEPAEPAQPAEPVAASPEPVTIASAEPDLEPEREPSPARRSDVLLDAVAPLGRSVGVDDADDPDGQQLTASLTGVPSSALSETSTVVIDEAALETFSPPVVGPVLTAARVRLALSVDQLAERTRIRPHVIEAIEVDAFETCGGDFYARGHLRTLARVLGVDAGPLLAEYDARYADAPIDPRRVFEAELATVGSSGRGAGGGLNWSVLIAVVMAVVLVWSVARLVMDGPVQLSAQPVLNGSPGGKASLSGATTKVPVTFTAVTGGARVIVRDAKQQVVFDEQLAFMQTAELSVAPPVRISSTDGGLEVSVDGVAKGALGSSGQDAQQTFVP